MWKDSKLVKAMVTRLSILKTKAKGTVHNVEGVVELLNDNDHYKAEG